MEFGDLFSFDKKIAPAIIKPIYWIGMIVIVAFGIFYFFWGFFSLFWHFGAGMWTMLVTLITVPLSVLGLRIASEVTLAVFEIHERTMGGSSSSQT